MLFRSVASSLLVLLNFCVGCLAAEGRPPAHRLSTESSEDGASATDDPQAAEATTAADEPVPIIGGDPVVACGWPNTVLLLSDDVLCTGTLLDPSLVVYAAHCGDAFASVRFGETMTGEGLRRVVPTEACAVFPGGEPGNGHDIAWCRLAEPVTDIPIVPPLLGCDLDDLTPGDPVTFVGFGRTEYGLQGVKHEVVAEFHGVSPDGELELGGDGLDTCQGDSGGPAFVQVGDGSWRTLGVTSWGGVCGDGGYSTSLPAMLPWLEEETGLDLSPCHTAHGEWAPGAGCDGFPLEPDLGHGQWWAGCVGPVAEPPPACEAAGGGPSAQGCVGYCGAQAPSGCWCDDACEEYGDCCGDIVEACPGQQPGCAEHCGEPAPAGCWCDEACHEHGDCCPDVDVAC